MKRVLSNLNKTFGLVLALVVVLLINIVSLTNNAIRVDMSGRKYYELSKKTTNLLKGLKHQVNITVLFQEEDNDSLYHDIENLLKEYRYKSRNIKVAWVDPKRDPSRTEKLKNKYGLDKAQVLVFEVDGRTKVVNPSDLADMTMVGNGTRSVISAFKGEQAFSSAIQGLVQDKAPVVYFLVGHGERSLNEFDQQTGYSRIGTVMEYDNLVLKELLLTSEKSVPDDAAALVILGPSKRMSPTAVAMIEDYFIRSGRVMILLDALKETGLEPMLRNHDIILRNDYVVDTENRLRENDVHVRRFNPHPINMNLDTPVRFVLPRSVMPLSMLEGEQDGAEDRSTVVPLALTSEQGWSETQVNDVPAMYNENTGDLRGTISLAVAVERGASKKMLDVQIQPSRMVVFGDSDFISNGSMDGGNQDLFMSAMNWLVDREELMAISAKPLEEVKLSLTQKELNKLAWINVGGIPLVAVVGGLLVWVRRRK